MDFIFVEMLILFKFIIFKIFRIKSGVWNFFIFIGFSMLIII